MIKLYYFCFAFILLSMYFSTTTTVGQKLLSCKSRKKSDRTVDLMLANITTFGNASRKFPENDEQLITYCGNQTADIRVIEKYLKRCKKRSQRQLTSILLATIKKQLNILCRNGSKKRPELMNSTKCWNNASVEIEACNQITINKLLDIKLAQNKQKIPFVCCEYDRFKKCYAERARNLHRDVCTDNHLKLLHEFIDSVDLSPLNLLCIEYIPITAANDKCNRIGAPPARNQTINDTNSLFMAMVQVFDTIV